MEVETGEASIPPAVYGTRSGCNRSGSVTSGSSQSASVSGRMMTGMRLPVRVATGAAATWQVVVAVALTVVTIGVATWLAARIHANSVSRTGTRVTFSEALSWR